MTQQFIEKDDVQSVLDEYAEAASPQYHQHAEKFQNLERWTGSDPVVLVMDAAGSATGLNYKNIVKPAVEAFRDEFVDSGKVTTFEDMIELEHDSEFEAAFRIGRPNIAYDVPGVLLENADEEDDDLALLQSWAENADPKRYVDDPVGAVKGIGLATFQYLRMIAGANTVKPDIQVRRFIEELEAEHPSFDLDSSSSIAVLESCEWLASRSTYSMIEIDQIAWWKNSGNADLSPAH